MRIIFHIPESINWQRAAASQLRPQKLLKTFQSLGYIVDFVEGTGSERKKQIKQIKQNIRMGIHYAFLYSESSTMPTLLTEKSHFPFYPFLDFSFLNFCQKRGIKIGLFYRDIYWCFWDKKNWKQKIASIFYYYDLYKYKKLVDVLFVPSLEMRKFIPFNFYKSMVGLPSGLDINFFSNKTVCDVFNILYVGGIGVHYNLKMIMKVVLNVPNFCLTVCCRKEDWDVVKDEYSVYITNNIRIVHKVGEELFSLFHEADMFNLFVEPTIYRSFAVPYKLYEALGYGCPILASAKTWVADFVKKNDIGYVVDYSENALQEFLINIKRDDLMRYKNNVFRVAKENTWEMRVNQIIDELF